MGRSTFQLVGNMADLENTEPCVMIGTKPFMNYVTAVVLQFTTKNSNEVSIKARGKSISRAVDVAEVATKRFLDGQVFIKKILTDSQDFKNREGKSVKVSTIEIILAKV